MTSTFSGHPLGDEGVDGPVRAVGMRLLSAIGAALPTSAAGSAARDVPHWHAIQFWGDPTVLRFLPGGFSWTVSAH